LPAALDARLDLDLDELMWTGSEVERLPSEQIDDRLRRRGGGGRNLWARFLGGFPSRN